MDDIKVMGELRNGGFYPRNPDLYMEKIRKAGDINECVLTITGVNKRSPDQNNYCFAMCNVIAQRVNQDGWNFTAYDVYKKIENDYCKEIAVNEKTGQEAEHIKPLKEQPPERFWEIVEQVRLDYMRRLDIHIKTPAEYYKLTEKFYDLWKGGAMSYAEARKRSNKQNGE